MGIENSKSDYDDEGESQRYHNPRRKPRQRLYTQDEINRALANQRRMFQAKQFEMRSSLTATDPEEFVFIPRNTTASGHTNQQNRSAPPPTHFPRSTTSSFAGPSDVTPNKRNQKINKPQRNRPRSSTNKSRVNQNTRELSGTVNCVTCNGQLGLHIYQCSNGHSSCDGCRFKMARCGNCTELITDMRNITLESTLAEMTISSEERIKCSNAKDGCCLHFKRDELQNHLKECSFYIIACPMMEFSGDCSWKGTIQQLPGHFNVAHPKHCEADVNRETHMIIMEVDYKVMHLVDIGNHTFLVHIRLDTSLNNIYMATQYLGTNFSASKSEVPKLLSSNAHFESQLFCNAPQCFSS